MGFPLDFLPVANSQDLQKSIDIVLSDVQVLDEANVSLSMKRKG